jgi:hypothetical protein
MEPADVDRPLVPTDRTERARADGARAMARTVIAGLLGVVAVIGLVASTAAVWAHETVFDEGPVTGAFDEALMRPVVTAELGSFVARETMAAIDLGSRMEARLPRNLTPLIPPIVGGVTAELERRVTATLRTDEARTIVLTVVGQGHASLLRLLDGDGLLDGVTLTDDRIVVDALPLIELGLAALADLGVVPDITVAPLAEGNPSARIDRLEASLDRVLPDDFGTLVVYEGGAVASGATAVAAAQDLVALVRRALVALVALTIVVAVASVVAARGRARALLVLSSATCLAFVVARLLLAEVVATAPSLAKGEGARSAVDAVLSSLTSGLAASLIVAAIISALIAGAAALELTGVRARWTARLRTRADRPAAG